MLLRSKYLAVLVNIMVLDRAKLLTFILDIIANVQIPVGVCLSAQQIHLKACQLFAASLVRPFSKEA